MGIEAINFEMTIQQQVAGMPRHRARIPAPPFWLLRQIVDGGTPVGNEDRLGAAPATGLSIPSDQSRAEIVDV
jgi:hypothetical protein